MPFFNLGVAHKFPWVALASARDSYDPFDYGPEDEVKQESDGKGGFVTVRTEWFRPPHHKRCDCQKGDGISPPCVCGLGAKPTGVAVALTWDKVDTENR